MDPTEFLESAKKMRGEPTEVSRRNAISRAYYSAYHAGLHLAHALEIPPPPKGVSAHKALSQVLQNEKSRDVIRVGQMLARSHARRVQADYRLGTAKCTLGYVNDQIRDCAHIVSESARLSHK